jgi:general secretion pathway protein E
MERAARGAFGLAALVVLAGMVAAVVPLPSSNPLTWERATTLLLAGLHSPTFIGAGIGCVALLATSTVMRRPTVIVPVRQGVFLPPLPPGAQPVEAGQLALAYLRDRLRHDSGYRALDAVAIVELLIHGAVQAKASDIHIHPLEDGTHVALRVHGALEEVGLLPRAVHLALLNRLKVLSKVVSFVSDRPQDGHFLLVTPDGPADMRVSFLPTYHGEKIVMRVARPGVALPEISGLGLPPVLRARLEALLAKPQGLIFFTGPTGSGKTTSIYAALGHILRATGGSTQIATIEDPIEFEVPAIAQTQVNAVSGLDFAQGLRALLRQDPNVIMVGEIRDVETARIAVQAGLTGHLILSTVHANSSAGVFNRLLEMNVEPFVLASVSVACISQRLVRALCEHCRKSELPRAQDAQRLEAAGLRVTPFAIPGGCDACHGLGYVGRAAIYEILMVTPAIRELIQQRVSSDKILDAAISEGTVPLLTAAVEAARQGTTTLAEAFRVAG